MAAVRPDISQGETREINGEQYYIIGKNRIKITEHFPASGKPLDELITGLIVNKIRESARKTA